MPKRDDFTRPTVDKLAKRAGYLCSNPHCRIPTIGGAQGHDGIINTGVAAHITAASVGGPRYDASLTKEQRRDQSNGIWMCQNHGKLVDSDEEHFTVPMLREWKTSAEKASFEALLFGRPTLALKLDPDDARQRVLTASAEDLQSFKQMDGWPDNPTELNLRVDEGSFPKQSFKVSGFANALSGFNEIAIVAPPGTGKTTTLIQLAEAVLALGEHAAIFVPLSEWATQALDLFDSIIKRPAFTDVSRADLVRLAQQGHLVLLLDGWNELDNQGRDRVLVELKQIRRNFPDLGIVMSTRRQALDVPVRGPRVGIDPLTSTQQLELARALRGEEGHGIIDRARRTPGVRELIAIPLYLTALVERAGSVLPSTKEEILRLFVSPHEEPLDKADALRTELNSAQQPMLEAIAVEATRTANTSVQESRAISIVAEVGRSLVDGNLLINIPQPMTVVDHLVDHHALVRSSGTQTIRFQHQQFQEYYASFAVERAIQQYTTSSSSELQQILNDRSWEEAILFACERMARTGQADAVGKAILLALSVDPMLAAEMTYRSTAAVWDLVGPEMVAFAKRWHEPGKLDRSVGFMMTTGKADFAEQIWSLIMQDDQIRLGAFRTVRRVRPEVLGPDAKERITGCSDQIRKEILSELIMQGGAEGIDLASELALQDPSEAVKFDLAETLMFRRAEVQAKALIESAPALWLQLAASGWENEAEDEELRTKLASYRRILIASEDEPGKRLSLMVEGSSSPADDRDKVAKIVSDPGLPIDNSHTLDAAFKKYPDEVAKGLKTRLELGLDLPDYGARQMLNRCTVGDDTFIANYLLDRSVARSTAAAAAGLAGPQIVRRLLQETLDWQQKTQASQGQERTKAGQVLGDYLDRLACTRFSSLLPALCDRKNETDPVVIGSLASIIHRHGDDDDRDAPLNVNDPERSEIVGTLQTWAETLIASNSDRHQMADLAMAIGRVPDPLLVDTLKRLLDEDVRRRREGIDPSMIWTNWYAASFASIGDEKAISILTTYLDDPDFGADAAVALKQIDERKRGQAADVRPMTQWPDFGQIRAARAQAFPDTAQESPLAKPIFEAADRLLAAERAEEQQRRGLCLLQIALSMPHRDCGAIIEAALNSAVPPKGKKEVLGAIALTGRVLPSSLISEAVAGWIEDAKKATWMFRERKWEIEGWLQLFAASDDPSAVLPQLVQLSSSHRIERMEGLVKANAKIAEPATEAVLIQLQSNYPQLVSDPEWINAFMASRSATAMVHLLNLIEDGKLKGREVGSWSLSNTLADVMKSNPDCLKKARELYLTAPPKIARLLELTFGHIGQPELLLMIIRGYGKRGQPFDGSLERAIENVAFLRVPSEGWVGAFEWQPVPVGDLRQQIFSMLEGTQHEHEIAKACLEELDEMRDDKGSPLQELRHPNLASGKPWPILRS